MEEQLGQLRLEQMMQELNNHANCKSWNTYCSVNSGNNGCETMKPMCSKQASANCLEGKFIVINSACIKKTCDTAAVSTIFDTDEKCSTYQQQYVVARKVGCQARAACTFYRSQLQCEYKCFWDQTNKTCVDLNCGNIEATSSFDSHNKCVTVDTTLACTVRATNGTAIAGSNCSIYKTKKACNSGGLDDICVFTQSTATGAAVDIGICSLMIQCQCTAANNDQTVCQAAELLFLVNVQISFYYQLSYQ